MKRILVLIALAAFAITGCAQRSHNIPAAGMQFADADYTVLGNTNAEACGSYIFGIDFASLFSKKAGTVGAAPDASPISAIMGIIFGAAGSPEGAAALYDALEKMPEATHLVAPRVHTDASGLIAGPVIIFGRRCATVDARGVVIADKPLPQAK